MDRHSTQERYGTLARWLHWAMFAIIAVQVAGGLALDRVPRTSPLRGFAFDAHETLGIVALLLVLARLAWNRAHPGPAPEGAGWQHTAAKAAHGALYLLMIAVPVAGYAMMDAKGYGVAFFGWEAPEFIATDAGLAERLNRLHERLAWAFAGLVALHVAAAFWHHFGLRDGTLRRMLPAPVDRGTETPRGNGPAQRA